MFQVFCFWEVIKNMQTAFHNVFAGYSFIVYTILITANVSGRGYRNGPVCVSVWVCETTLCTTSWVQDYVVHHWPATDQRCAQCSSVLTYTLVVHNIAWYWLGGVQDNFACWLSTLTVMVHNTRLSVSVCFCMSVCLLAHSRLNRLTHGHQILQRDWPWYLEQVHRANQGHRSNVTVTRSKNVISRGFWFDLTDTKPWPIVWHHDVIWWSWCHDVSQASLCTDFTTASSCGRCTKALAFFVG